MRVLTPAHLPAFIDRFVKEYGLDPNSTALMAGCALVMHRVRQLTHDVDVQVSAADFSRL